MTHKSSQAISGIAIDPEDEDQPLLMISAVAKMIGVHPQTLRLYEKMGFIHPHRANGKNRLYSFGDIKKLQFIQNLTREHGVNLAGVGLILKLQRQLNELQREMGETVRELRKSFYQEERGFRKGSDEKRTAGVQIKIEHE